MSDLDYNFEVFNGRAMPVSSSPTISMLGRRGRIGLNNAAFEALGQPLHVELLFDKEKRIVGIRVAKQKDNHTYPVQQHKSAKSFVIHAKAFFNYYDLEKRSKRYNAKAIKNVLIVDLNGPFEDVDRTSKSLTDGELHALDKHVASG